MGGQACRVFSELKKLFAENPQLVEEDYLVTSEQSPRIRIVENKKESK